jgi:hypothetical protein
MDNTVNTQQIEIHNIEEAIFYIIAYLNDNNTHLYKDKAVKINDKNNKPITRYRYISLETIREIFSPIFSNFGVIESQSTTFISCIGDIETHVENKSYNTITDSKKIITVWHNTTTLTHVKTLTSKSVILPIHIASGHDTLVNQQESAKATTYSQRVGLLSILGISAVDDTDCVSNDKEIAKANDNNDKTISAIKASFIQGAADKIKDLTIGNEEAISKVSYLTDLIDKASNIKNISQYTTNGFHPIINALKNNQDSPKYESAVKYLLNIIEGAK